MTTKIHVTLFSLLIYTAVFSCLIKAQRQIPSSSNQNQFFPQQRPILQLIQLHAQQQQRPPSPLNQRRLFRTRQQPPQSFVTRKPIPRISLHRRSLSSASSSFERSLRAGISRSKPARIILDPNLSNEITSENKFPPQVRTQGNADFSRIATTVPPQQRIASVGQSQQRPPPIEVTASRVPMRPPVLRRPPPQPSQTSLPQRPPQHQQRQPPPQRPPLQQQQRSPMQLPRSSPPQQQQQQLRSPMQQQQSSQRSQLPQRPSTQPIQQQPFLRPPASMVPRQNSQNRPPISPPLQRQQTPRPQPRPQPPPSLPPHRQQQTFNQPPAIQQQPPPPPTQRQQQMRPRITPEQRFTRPEQARILPPPTPIGPPRPSTTTNNIDDSAISSPQQPRARPPAHMPGFFPPSNSVVDELNNSVNFLEVARRLHLRRVIRGAAH